MASATSSSAMAVASEAHPLAMGSRFVVAGDAINPHAVAVVVAVTDDATRHLNGGQAGELYHVEMLAFYSAAELQLYAPEVPSRRLDQCRVVRVQLPPLPSLADGGAEAVGHQEEAEEGEQEEGEHEEGRDQGGDDAAPQRDREAANARREELRDAQLAEAKARKEARRAEADVRRATGQPEAEARR
eukprot:4436748-Prymnesium_polylepis.1